MAQLGYYGNNALPGYPAENALFITSKEQPSGVLYPADKESEISRQPIEPPINLTPVQPNLPPINISPLQATSPPDPAVADKRAFKAKFGVTDTPKTYEEYKRGILEGKERELRAADAAHRDYMKQQAKVQAITEFAKAKKGPLTPDELKYVEAIIKAHDSPTSPTSIWEEMYSTEYINQLDKTINPDIPREIPKEYAAAKAAGGHVTTIVELLKTAQEENDAVRKQQSMFGFILDVGKNISQLYTEAKLRGGVPGTLKTEGVLLGERMFAESSELFRKTIPEADKIIKENMAIFNRDNPVLGAQWLQYMLGQSTSERVMNNIMTVAATPVTTVGVGVAAAKAVGLRRQAGTAVQSMVKRATNTEANPVAINEAAGDWKEAGIQKSVSIYNQTMQPVDISDPTRVGKDFLHSLYDTAANDVISGSPNASREIATRVAEDMRVAGGRLIEGIAAAVKIDRVDGLLAVETAIRKEWDRIKHLYVGLDNMVVNTSVPYIDRLTGSQFVDFHLARPDGTAFKSATEAENVMFQSRIEGRVVGMKDVTTKREEIEPTFTTTSGVKYKVNEDGTTSRAAIKRGKGVKAEAEGAPVRTVYVSKEASQGIKGHIFGAKVKDTGLEYRAVIEGNKLVPYSRTTEIPWARSENAVEIEFNTAPAKGLVPVELSGPKKLQGREAFSKVFFGDEIAESIQKATIEQQGNGYFIAVTSNPLKLDDLVIRDAVAATAETGTNSWSGAWAGILGKYVTADELFTFSQNAARKIAAMAPAELFKIIKEGSKAIDAIRPTWVSPPYSEARTKWKQWNQVVDASRKMQDPITKEPGYLMKNISELNTQYMNLLERLPDDQEIAAYFAWANNVRARHVFLNVFAKRNKDYHGMKTWTLQQIDPTTETSKSFKYLTKDVDGTRTFNIKDAGDDPIIIFGNKVGEEKPKLLRDIKGKYRTQLEEKIQNGSVIMLKLSDNKDRVLEGFTPAIGNERVRTIIIPTAVEKPLTWDQLKNVRVPADYDAKYYIKQGVLVEDKISKKTWYERDKTFWAVNINSMGKDVVKKLEHMRLLLKDGKIDEARNANPIGVDFDDLRTQIDVNEPFVLVNKSQMVGDIIKYRDRPEFNRSSGKGVYKGEFRDGTIEGFGRYIDGEPDVHELFSIENRGTKANPIYSLVPAKQVDAMTSMNRAINNVVNKMFTDDYKVMAINSWMQRAKGLLEAKEADIIESPFYYFYEGKFRPGDDKSTINRLETERMQIRQFLGIYDETSSLIHWSTQKLVDSIYDKGGERLALKAAYLLPHMTDPVGFLRYMTFHAKLGLFAIPQLWVQAQGFVNVMAIAGPGMAMPAMKAYLFHTWARINKNPATLDKLDEMASRSWNIPGMVNFKPGQFKEAHEGMRSTGFGIIGGEYALVDNPLGFEMVTHAGKKFLNAGKWFFTEGERLVRQTAFYTAYLEYRATKPTGKLVDADWRNIVQRADNLSINMTRASNSQLHTGIMSIPAQFLTYQLRMTELMVGKRLTTAERMRLWGWNAALYGIPTSLGVVGLPTADWMRREALVNGYVPGEKYIDTAVHEGIPATLLGLATGQWYNINERFGLQGVDQVKEILYGDKPFIKLVGGAAGSVIGDVVSAAHPLWEATVAMLDPNSTKLQVTDEAMADLFKTISSHNITWRGWAAYNTGKWLNKRGATIDTNVSPLQAVMMSAFGVQRTKASDVNLFIQANKDIDEKVKYVTSQIIQEYRRAALNYETNREQSLRHLSNIKAWFEIGDVPRDKQDEILSIAFGSLESLSDKIPRDFFQRKTLTIPGRAQTNFEILQKRERFKGQ